MSTKKFDKWPDEVDWKRVITGISATIYIKYRDGTATTMNIGDLETLAKTIQKLEIKTKKQKWQAHEYYTRSEMAILNYTTTISAEKSVQQIQNILSRHGASSISIGYMGGYPS